MEAPQQKTITATKAATLSWKDRKAQRREAYEQRVKAKEMRPPEVHVVMIKLTPSPMGGLTEDSVLITRFPDGTTAPNGFTSWLEAESKARECNRKEAELQKKYAAWGKLQEEIDEHRRGISIWKERLQELQNKISMKEQALAAAEKEQQKLAPPPPNFVYRRRRHFDCSKGKGGEKFSREIPYFPPE